MKRLSLVSAGLLLAVLLSATALATEMTDAAQGGAAAPRGVSKSQADLVKSRAAMRARVEEMQVLRARTIEEEKKADEEAKKKKESGQ